jgi:hypothetical protein
MQGCNYFDAISTDLCDSKLECPNGTNIFQNAWLTVTINYSLNFVDRNNRAGIVYPKGNKFYVKDSDKDEFEALDWDYVSLTNFHRRFRDAGKFWNYKFLLQTPRNYADLDFTSFQGDGWRCRPNVICLFRLSTGSPTHAVINVMRPDRSFWQKVFGTEFRSNSGLYDIEDVQTKTVAHELGHLLDQLHIQALLGNANCQLAAHINDDICYVTPPNMPSNIMGSGNNLNVVNAKPWLELIELHTGRKRSDWPVTMAVDKPPRRIPLGVDLVAPVTEF